MDDVAKHVTTNRAYWNSRAHDWVAAGERAWAAAEPSWGIWNVPESELRLLSVEPPGAEAGAEAGAVAAEGAGLSGLQGLRAVELGCGTGYVSGWMARRGADVTAIDVSEEQLATARRLADQHGAKIDFVHGNAEATPFEDGAFDFAISEYGAAIWCDPRVWLPEAHRILRPGGRLRFLGNHPLIAAFSPEDGSKVVRTLQRPYFGTHLLDWSAVPFDPGGIEFSLTFGDWIELFGLTGFDIEGFREPRPTVATGEERFFVSDEWARSWPSEQVWCLRKR